MDLWLLIGIGIGALAALSVARTVRARIERRRQPRAVEMPNSYYTSRLVVDRDARERWRAIPLERVHEINREEVRRLLAASEAHGIDRLTVRERTFLDRMAELYPPARKARGQTRSGDPLWSDPFGFQPPLGSRPGGR